MTGKNKLNIGLMRHGLETGGSIQYYFSSLKEQLSSSFELSLLPGYYYQLGVDGIKAMMASFLPGLDILYATNGKFPDYTIAPFYTREKQALEVPVIYQPLGEFPRGAAGFRAIYRYFRPCDTIIFSSSADREIYRKLVADMPCKDCVIPFGIDTEHFKPVGNDKRMLLRRELGISEDAFLLLYVGRITSEKNVHFLLECFKTVYQTHSESYLLLLGNIEDVPFREFGTGPYDLQEKFRQLPLGECIKNIRFFGGVASQELPRFYSAADLFVNFTLHHDENFGYTQVEAMACGLPLVVSNWGGLRDTVDESCGIRIPVHMTRHGLRVDKYHAVQAITSLMENESRRSDLAAAARKRAMDHYAVTAHGRAIGELALEMKHQPMQEPYPQPRLSELGNNLLDRAKQYHEAKTATLFSHKDELDPVYRELIEPYMSSAGNLKGNANKISFLASPFTAIDDERITVSDPLWPFELGNVTDDQKTLVRYIGENGFLDIDSMPSAFDHEVLANTIDTLVEAGLLISTDRKAC
ncbi:MAG: glycosyltransferase family 4 protein [Thiotrichales bacterium]|nr:glycosyltransferase family 4 protein [Thiotrichales bacterium]